VRPLLAFPLRVGGVRLGALTLHQDRPGRLSDRQYADALAVADLLLRIVLARQADAPPGILAGELLDLSDSRAEVHQASGMVSVQLGVSVGEALVRLRAHAYAEGRTLAAVGADVVARRLRMDG
jgi:ANTAR domain